MATGVNLIAPSIWELLQGQQEVPWLQQPGFKEFQEVIVLCGMDWRMQHVCCSEKAGDKLRSNTVGWAFEDNMPAFDAVCHCPEPDITLHCHVLFSITLVHSITIFKIYGLLLKSLCSFMLVSNLRHDYFVEQWKMWKFKIICQYCCYILIIWCVSFYLCWYKNLLIFIILKHKTYFIKG